MYTTTVNNINSCKSCHWFLNMEYMRLITHSRRVWMIRGSIEDPLDSCLKCYALSEDVGHCRSCCYVGTRALLHLPVRVLWKVYGHDAMQVKSDIHTLCWLLSTTDKSYWERNLVLLLVALQIKRHHNSCDYMIYEYFVLW